MTSANSNFIELFVFVFSFLPQLNTHRIALFRNTHTLELWFLADIYSNFNFNRNVLSKPIN